MKKIFLHFDQESVDKIIVAMFKIDPEDLLECINKMGESVVNVSEKIDPEKGLPKEEFFHLVVAFYAFFKTTNQLREDILSLPQIKDEEEQRDVLKDFLDEKGNITIVRTKFPD